MNEYYMTQVRQAFAEPQVRQAFVEAMGVSLREAAKALGECGRAAADMVAALLRDADPWYKALNWAKRQYPEWVAIMNRTKKRRVRKKYKNRILRAYKEVSAG